jgi:hypothetical protein
VNTQTRARKTLFISVSKRRARFSTTVVSLARSAAIGSTASRVADVARRRRYQARMAIVAHTGSDRRPHAEEECLEQLVTESVPEAHARPIPVNTRRAAGES